MPSKPAFGIDFEMAKFTLYALSGCKRCIMVFKGLFVAGKAMGIIMAYYLSLGLGAVITVIFLFKRSSGATVPNLLLKIGSSLGFLLTAVMAVILNPTAANYGVLLLMGGALGMIGDIVLDLKYIYPKDSDTYLYSGFTAFLIGHLFFNAAVIWHNHLSLKLVLIAVAISVVIAILNLLSGKITKLEYGKFKPIVFAYSAILILTTATAAVSFFAVEMSKSMLLMTIGGVLFLLSDVVLSFTYFGKGFDKPVHIFVNHLLYYAAQYLIAASIFCL